MYFSQCIDFIIEAVVELILSVYYIYENELNWKVGAFNISHFLKVLNLVKTGT